MFSQSFFVNNHSLLQLYPFLQCKSPCLPVISLSKASNTTPFLIFLCVSALILSLLIFWLGCLALFCAFSILLFSFWNFSITFSNSYIVISYYRINVAEYIAFYCYIKNTSQGFIFTLTHILYNLQRRLFILFFHIS